MKAKQILSLLLVFILVFNSVPFVSATESGTEAQPQAKGNTLTNLNNVVETYIDEANETEIIESRSSSVAYDEKKPQDIYGYTYREYTEKTKHVYSHNDITYIYGYPDVTVRGEASLTRAEASAIFYRLYDGDYPKFTRRMSDDTFTDVNAKSWFYKEVETLYNAEIIEGYKDHTFKPNDPVTRAEFAVLVAKWSNLKYVDKATFKDVPSGHWAYSYINAAADVGWIKGYKDGTYEPDRNITRAETVKFINGMVNRDITVDELKALGVKNPYKDLVEGYWAYTDIMEATVKHSGADWHGTKYNDGKFNVIIERFTDISGKKLVDDVVTNGKEAHAFKSVDKYEYLGYVTEITYTYADNKSATLPYITKTVSKATALVGDKLTYTVTMGNDKGASYEIENAVMTDKIPAELDFVVGSVQVDGKTKEHSFDDKTNTLTVNVGGIKPEQNVVVTFSVIPNKKAYGKTIKNTAIMKGDNTPEKEGADSGIQVTDGETESTLVKVADKAKAKVGEMITYTLTAKNGKAATVPIRNAIITDTLPEELDFNHGSVQINGKASTEYTYDANTRTLILNLGDIDIDQEVKATFAVTINPKGYGKTLQNLATLEGENTGKEQDKDDGVKVDDGTAIPSITKAADKAKAKVGEPITYTIKVKNDAAASVNLKDAILKDSIPEHLTFTYGSVQVDGYAWTAYAYNNTTKLLTVELGEIAPNQTKTVTFTGTVNATAYGKTFENTAVISSSNAKDETATDDGVVVDKGTADGSAGTKSVDKTTAKVGDVLTYSIQIKNGAMATAPWDNVTITDVIPDELSFNNGSVEKNGNATTEYTYHAATKTLTLKPASIAIGETVTFTFTAVVKDGAQGKFVVNTAILHSNKGDTNLPDTGVTIDAGKAEPSLEKASSVATAAVGDILTYTVTMKNKPTATAAWKNVIFTDTIPAELKLVSGSITLNGATVSYGVSGQAISVNIGDLIAGDEAVIKFQAKILDTAEGKKIVNTAMATGDNGEKRGTDDGVDVPKDKGVTNPATSAYGSKDVDTTLIDIVNGSKMATFTVKAGNNSANVWKDVALYDVLDTSMLTLMSDSITVDGIKYTMASKKWSFSDRQLIVNLGDLQPGEEKVIEFTVEFKADAGNSSYVNHATLKGLDHENKDLNVKIKSPEIIIKGNDPSTDIHIGFFSGFGDHLGNPLHIWKPIDNIKLVDMCRVGYRLMTDNHKNQLGAGTITVPSGLTNVFEVQFMISHGIIKASDYGSNATNATEAQIYNILNFSIRSNLYSVSTAPMKRNDVAKLVCQLTKRDVNPDTNGYTLLYFSDKGAFSKLIDEVSNTHDYMIDSYGHETWIYNASIN